MLIVIGWTFGLVHVLDDLVHWFSKWWHTFILLFEHFRFSEEGWTNSIFFVLCYRIWNVNYVAVITQEMNKPEEFRWGVVVVGHVVWSAAGPSKAVWSAAGPCWQFSNCIRSLKCREFNREALLSVHSLGAGRLVWFGQHVRLDCSLDKAVMKKRQQFHLMWEKFHPHESWYSSGIVINFSILIIVHWDWPQSWSFISQFPKMICHQKRFE